MYAKRIISPDSNIYISCNACKRREIDSILIEKYLVFNNYKVVKTLGTANVIIFFTCSFSEEMSLDSYNKLEYYFLNFDHVIVCGCFPTIGMHKADFLSNIITIKNDKLQDIETYFPPRSYSLAEIKDGNDIYYDDIFSDDVFLIRISRGCLGNCSYCAIKKAIGTHRSKNIDEILAEVELAISQQYSYIRLVADDGGAYGLDVNSNIINLLIQLCKYKKLKGIELEINPKWALKYKDGLIQIIRDNPTLSYKITLPIQTASSRILKLMNREISIQELGKLLNELKLISVSNIFLTTHIITGYPTEDRDDLIHTLDFLIENKFDQINIFPLTLHPSSQLAKEYKSGSFSIDKNTNYIVDNLLANEYDIIDSSVSQTMQWQRVILRLNRKLPAHEF